MQHRGASFLTPWRKGVPRGGTLPSRQRRAVGAGCLAATLAAGVLAAAPGEAQASKGGGQAVNVLYAGSLVGLMEHQLGPAFHAATGDTITGYAGGSDGLAADIAGGVYRADVFISANPSVNDHLEGSKHGKWVTWYVPFARSPLVLGYSPRSRFAHELKTQPWYDVVTKPGFRLGRTDPATDPKGKLAVTAMDETARAHHHRALSALTRSTSGVFPEQTLVGRLQAGQLDAGFFYSSEAKQAGIPTVALPGSKLAATYTVTVVDHAPHPGAARAFVDFLLSRQAASLLRRQGFELLTPEVVGSRNAAHKALGAAAH